MAAQNELDSLNAFLDKPVSSKPNEKSEADSLNEFLAAPANQKDLGTQPTMTFQAEAPSPLVKVGHGAAKAWGGIMQGIHKVGDTVQSAANDTFGTNFDTGEYKRFTENMNEGERLYQKGRADNGQTGFDGWSFLGELGAGAPAGLAGTGRTLLGTVGRGAVGGAGIGAAQFAENGNQRLKNIGAGAVGGALGGAAGKGIEKIAKGASNKATQKANQEALDAPRNNLTQQARDTGYTVPPSYSNPNTWNKSWAKIAGEADLGKIASAKNQDITNSLAKRAVGIPENQPITPEALNAVRQDAGRAYEIVGGLGRVKVDQRYLDDYKKIVEPYLNMANDFNLDVSNDVIKAMQQASPKNGDFDAKAALHVIRSLRNQASKAYKNNDTELGQAMRSMSEAFERQLERALLKNTKVPREAVHNYVNARKIIAKTHSIEDALNEVGDVSATKLASMLGKGAPLEGELKQVAQFGSAYPQLNNVGRHGGAGVTFADTLIGAGGAMVDPTGISLIVARPALRHGLTTKAAGKLSGTPKYRSKRIEALVKAGILSPYAPVAGATVNKD